MEGEVKGTVTSLASMFPVDEAQKAVKRVEEAVEDKKKELENLKHFISDNTNLINLVSKLPEELHHDIMVPFGKAAFFPGRLIHTNEFLVLLGEGYYAERASKQTVEILKRRGKALDSEVEALKANLKDLKAEASFFDSTAFDAAEGLVEIREDYKQENSVEDQSQSGDKIVNVEEDEYARMMSRLDELEREEELAGEGNEEGDQAEETSIAESEEESDEDEQTRSTESDEEVIEEAESNEVKTDNYNEEFNITKGTHIQLPDQSYSKIEKLQKLAAEDTSTETPLDNCSGLTVQPLPKAKAPLVGKEFIAPEVKERTEAFSSYGNEAIRSSMKEHPQNIQNNLKEQNVASSQTSRSGFDTSKAFTGSIVEHTENLQITSRDQSATSSEPSNARTSKPVSRFKMQRR